MLRILLFAFLGLAACAPVGPEQPSRRMPSDVVLPPMKTFGAARVTPPQRSNGDMANDFLELSFQMESGRSLPVLTRFEGPITVSVAGPAPATLGPDLDQVIARFRREAGIDVSRAPKGKKGRIAIEVLPRRELQRFVPQAACFVVPRVSSWAEFRANRRSRSLDWSTLTTRDQVAVFIPDDVSPQEVRDCLHEELAQAMGPLNDLYRLPDSVFNDDNFHTILTGFDMLMLRVYYSPELASGMSRDQVAARLPALLARLNPAGGAKASTPAGPTPRAWIEALETALGPNTGNSARRAAASKAVAIAQQQGWTDTRLAFSIFALGRLSLPTEADLALSSFITAGRIYRSSPTTRVQSAHVAMQLAVFALSSGDAETALDLVNANLGVVADAQNAALLATLLIIKTQALENLGRPAEARAVRLDSLGWGRYGFGSDKEVRARLSEIAVLSPNGAKIKG
jgi:hypothetical protein